MQFFVGLFVTWFTVHMNEYFYWCLWGTEGTCSSKQILEDMTRTAMSSSCLKLFTQHTCTLTETCTQFYPSYTLGTSWPVTRAHSSFISWSVANLPASIPMLQCVCSKNWSSTQEQLLFFPGSVGVLAVVIYADESVQDLAVLSWCWSLS